MRLAVCLLTADRPDYTAETVATFTEHVVTSDMLLLHADDGSQTMSNVLIAQAGGFETVYETKHREGPLSALRAMWSVAVQHGATHILHLENDWEFCGPLPTGFDARQCVRLYGERKGRTGERQMTGPNRMGTKQPIDWFDLVPNKGWQLGNAHWAGPPSVTHAHLLIDAVFKAQTFKDLSLLMNTLETVRPRENVVWHIGDKRTPGARFNV